MDSKRDPGASQFISRTDKTLRFSLKAFQFTSDPDTEVSVEHNSLDSHSFSSGLTLFPFLGQYSLQIICHIWGPGSCTQIMHLQIEQVRRYKLISIPGLQGTFSFCCWAYLCICHDRWEALTGDDSICECCDSQCVTSKPRRAMMEGMCSPFFLY